MGDFIILKYTAYTNINIDVMFHTLTCSLQQLTVALSLICRHTLANSQIQTTKSTIP